MFWIKLSSVLLSTHQHLTALNADILHLASLFLPSFLIFTQIMMVSSYMVVDSPTVDFCPSVKLNVLSDDIFCQAP